MDEETNNILREIRDDQREALNLTKASFRAVRIMVWLLVGFVLFAGAGVGVLIATAIIKINSLE